MNLITGATGIVGAHIALQLLQQNKPVVAIKRASSNTEKTKKLFSYYTSNAESLFEKIIWRDADVTDIHSLLEALEGVSTVYHCAGFVSFNNKHKSQLYKINSEGTANMVNACLEKNISIFCHVSSIATLQNPDIVTNIDESVFWKSSPDASYYAISKYNGEREVWRGIEEGLPAIIVNPGAIISPGFWDQSSGKIIKTCYQGNVFYTSGTTGYIAATDVASCMINLVNQKQFGQRFVLTEGNYAIKQILSMINNALGKKVPYIKANKPLLHIAAYLEKLKCFFTNQEPTLTKQIIPSIIEKNTYNNLKIKTTLAFQFTPISQSINLACKAFLSDLTFNKNR